MGESDFVQQPVRAAGVGHVFCPVGKSMNVAQGRPRDIALEKHGPHIEAQILQDLEKMREAEASYQQASSPEPYRGRRGPDMDMDR